MSAKPVQNYVPALTGVRALAAYLVFISHYEYAFDESFPHPVQRFFQEFHIGVTIFFVLSGFLIAFRYFDTFKLTKDWFKQYLKNRVARIYPMYLLLTTAAFISFFFTADPRITEGHNAIVMYLMNIVFLRGFFNDFKFTGIAPGWSLTVEECFYFSAPIMFFMAKKYGKSYLQPILITGFGCLLVLTLGQLHWFGLFGNFTFLMVYTFLGRCFEFFIGIQLALYVRRKGLERSNKINFTYTGFALIFVCVWVISTLAIPAGWSAGLFNPLGIITNNYFLATSIALFFYGLLTESTLLKKLLSNKFIELLGKSSYIFYLIHLGYLYNYLHRWFDQLNEWVFSLYDKWGLDWHSPFEYNSLNVLYAFILLNALSVLLFRFIEEPLNHYIRKSDFLIKATKPNKTNL